MTYPKIPQTISNPVNDNIQKLASLFPSAVKDGELDIDALKQELGDFTEAGPEKYELTWAGKQQAKQVAFEPIVGKTLQFVPEDSKYPETTENLFIEGDNLEVLKLLRQNYYGAVKMICIDPPYNTGNDFIYNDNFKMSRDESDKAQGNMSDLGERYTRNRKDHNRYHANWLNMMYPRLRVAKDLLRDDGVIFIHIDDNEVHNLRTVCDEIFGDESFINQISIKAKPSSGASGGGEDIKLKKNIEYLVCYCKNKHLFRRFNDVYEEKNLISYINEYREEGKSWKYTRVLISFGTKTFYKEIKDGAGKAIKIFKHEDIEIATLKDLAKNEKLTEEEVYFKYFDRIFRDTNAQSSIRQRVIDATDTDDTFYSIEYYPVSGRSKGILSTLYYKGRNKDLIAWLSDVASKENGKLIKRGKVGTLWDSFNWNNVSKEGNIQYPNGKKPISFIQRMIRLCSIDDKSDIILDFFAGSGSTAHAVIAENLHDGGDRKIISIELPELISENNKNKCYASVDLNHLNTIADICKERIRRAGEKILEENKDKEGIKNLDIGFKVFRVADTNINWLHQDLKGYDLFDHYDKNASDKDKLDFMPGFTDLDVVYEIMLRQTDIPLSSKVVQLSDIGQRTYMFADSFVVCLEQGITPELVNRLAAIEPLPVKFVFRDSAFDDDIALKDETFRRLNALIEKNSGGEKQIYTVEFI